MLLLFWCVFSNRFIFWMFLSDSSEVRVGSFVSFVGLFARSRAKNLNGHGNVFGAQF
jgi:hypothetical protein